MLHKTAILVKSGHFTEKMSAGFSSDVQWLLCLSAAFYFSGSVTSNDLVRHLQLWSANSQHVAFRILRESQSWGRAVTGHHLNKIWPVFTQIVVLCDIWTCIVKFCFSKQWVLVKVTCVALSHMLKLRVCVCVCVCVCDYINPWTISDWLKNSQTEPVLLFIRRCLKLSVFNLMTLVFFHAS